jgi:hypothetical protein
VSLYDDRFKLVDESTSVVVSVLNPGAVTTDPAVLVRLDALEADQAALEIRVTALENAPPPPPPASTAIRRTRRWL